LGSQSKVTTTKAVERLSCACTHHEDTQGKERYNCIHLQSWHRWTSYVSLLPKYFTKSAM
jgi:hypothetical protein